MSASKRVGSARRSYVFETVERRVLLSAAPAGWHAAPIVVMAQFAPVAGATAGTTIRYADGTASPDSAALTPDQVRGAYGITGLTVNGVVGTGAGQTIAIVDAYDDPTAATDLATFSTFYGLPAANFTKIGQNGQPISGANNPGTDPAGPTYVTGESTWEGEESLDIEWAHVIAPDAAIVLVECNSDGNDLYTGVLAARQLPNVSVISMSWGGDEYASETSDDTTYFTTPAGHQGITFVASAGDNGIYEPGDASDTVAPEYPAASPNVVSVGGTSLFPSGDAYGSETGWGNGALSSTAGGGGGGVSAYESAPAYQTFVTGDIGGGFRTYPDVAMLADPATGVSIVDSYDTGSASTPWIDGLTGGTSLAAPMFGGVMAIVNQERTSQGLATLDGKSQTLPHLYELPDAAFHDITSGDNGDQAGTGYDLVTGRGSPVGTQMVADLTANYIGYHVFDDINVDGIQEAGEHGVANVTVELESVAGSVLQTTTTDQDGFYQFLNPAPNSYLVHFVAPGGFQISPTGTTGTSILQSTADPATGNAAASITGTGVIGMSDYPYANCGMFSETISISDATIQRPQSGTANMTFTVTITPGSATTTFAVPYATADGTTADDTSTTGPATVAHDDYQATSGTIVFAPGVVTETITVVILGNTAIEKDLLFTVALSPPSSQFDLADSNTVGTGTIVNTSFPSVVIDATSADSLIRPDSGTATMLFPVTLSAAAPFPVTVSYTTTDVTAVANIDYLTSTGTLTFDVDPNTGLTASLTQNITVTILGGTNRQLNKQFAVNVAASTDATTGNPSQVEGTIVTNSPPGINAVGGSITESLTGTALLPFEVEVAPSLTSPVTVNYTTADGTAIAGVDYQAMSGTLTLSPGRVQQTVFVPVFRQFLSEMDKTLSFTISDPSAAIDLVSPTVTGTIHYLPVTTLPISRNQKAIYTDTLGQKVTVGLTGPGSGTIVFLGSDSVATNAYELSFTGTTAASNVSVSVSGTGQTTVNSIVVDGSLNALSAKAVNVQQGVVSISGTINSLVAGYLSATAVTLGGSATSRPASVNIRRAVDTSITSGAPIRTLVAGAYIDTTPATPVYITAPSVGTVRVAGNFGGTIRTSGMVAALQVGGALTGGVESDLGIGSVVADSISGAVLTAGAGSSTGTVADTTFTNANATIGRIQVKSTFSDSLIAGSHVGRVTLGSVDSSASGSPFGIVGSHIASLKTTTSSGSILSVANPHVQFKYEDFEVNLV